MKYESLIEAIMVSGKVTHQCYHCNEVKERNEFGKPKRTLLKEGERFYWICKKCKKQQSRAYLIKSKYKISLEEFEAMVISQGGCCAICGLKPKRLDVDHDHETKKVRGLLCHRCNVMIGHAKDNGLILELAAAYLDKHDTNSKE